MKYICTECDHEVRTQRNPRRCGWCGTWGSMKEVEEPREIHRPSKEERIEILKGHTGKTGLAEKVLQDVYDIHI